MFLTLLTPLTLEKLFTELATICDKTPRMYSNRKSKAKPEGKANPYEKILLQKQKLNSNLAGLRNNAPSQSKLATWKILKICHNRT